MSPQVQEALLRAGQLFAVAFLGGAIPVYLASHNFGVAASAGLVAGLAAFGIRTSEGVRDSRRAVRGDVRPSDVGFSKAP